MNQQQSVNADTVIASLAQRIANLTVDAAVKDAHIAALTAELAAKEPLGDDDEAGPTLYNDAAVGEQYGGDTGPLAAVG